jgi:predicted RNA binding protein YcfA (HicA-like mRNA interferase family)
VSADEKLLEKLRRRPSEADFRDLERLLKGEGWERTRQKGSLVSFEKVGEATITVPMVRGRKVKRIYINKVLTWLGLDR